jgi:hypothetical protein
MLLHAVACVRLAPVLAIVVPLRCSLLAPQAPRDTGPSAAQPKREEAPARVSSALPRSPRAAAPVEAIALPDEVVVRAVGVGQPAFLRCWARAQRTDAALGSAQIAAKVRLRLAIDAAGRVTSVESDSDSEALSRCLAVVARHLPFPAPGQPATVELPLLFR